MKMKMKKKRLQQLRQLTTTRIFNISFDSGKLKKNGGGGMGEKRMGVDVLAYTPIPFQ